jgi:hypothetical protein
MRTLARLLGVSGIALLACSAVAQDAPAWRELPLREPDGRRSNTGAFVIGKGQPTDWQKPPFRYDASAATGRKLARVVVLIYDPVLEAEGGVRLTEHVKANDPLELSMILRDVVREASWGYVNYEIADVIRVDGYPVKVDGFRYDDASFLQVRKTQEWQPATISYRKLFEENGLLERCAKEDIRELWLWGASGMHFDEFAGYVPNRYARFGPTDNPWLYRPYDIPEELGRTTWVMGFNYEVGADNMIHSYSHRVESMAALAFGDGVWDPATRRDPWNVFTWLETEHPGTPSQVGNCHVPPNGERGYDYQNKRRVPSWAWHWHRYPDLSGEPSPISSAAWGDNQFGYQKWLLERLPKFPGHTEHGYANWWVYVANPDLDLADWAGPAAGKLVLPAAMPAPASGR